MNASMQGLLLALENQKNDLHLSYNINLSYISALKRNPFMKKTLLLLFLTFTLAGVGKAQDIHFTQFTMSPLMLNPANTGAFKGSFRVGGIYRSQWSHFTTGYETPVVYIDAPIIRGFRAYDWIGVGLNVFQDKAGVANMQFGGLQISASYHLALNKTRRDVITFGFGGGQVDRRIDLTRGGIKLGDELADPSLGMTSMDRTGIQGKTNYTDLNAGLLYTRKLSEKQNLRMGLSLMHLNRPQYRLRGGNRDNADRQPMRWTGHAEMGIGLNDKWSVTPAVYVQSMTNLLEIQAQALAGYLLNAEKDITIFGGGGMRLGDAIPLIVGVNWKNIRAGLSFDYNFTDVTPNGNGGFELAVSYIGTIFKKPTVDPVIICPRFL